MGDSQDIGTAGEHAVTSEMLYRGFNASIMSVDTGIDVVAIKENKTYLVQVKTAKISKIHGNYIYDIRTKSLTRFGSADVFYIFVLRNKDKNLFLIIPASRIEEQIKMGAIKTYGAKHRVTLICKGDKIYLGNKNNDITYFLNNWGILK